MSPLMGSLNDLYHVLIEDTTILHSRQAYESLCVFLDDLRCGTKPSKQINNNDTAGNKISHYWVGVTVPLCKLYLHLL